MNITVEAIYEAGVLKPLQPLPNLQEREKVRITVERESVISRQRRERLQLEPEALRELMENREQSLLDG